MFFYVLFFSKKKLLYPFKKIGQNDEASRWRVSYEQGLPCLVSYNIAWNLKVKSKSINRNILLTIYIFKKYMKKKKKIHFF